MQQLPARLRSQRFARDGAGSAAVEIALILPVLLMFLLGVMEFGRLFFTQASLQYAVSQAARCRAIGAAACASDSQTASFAASKVAGVKVDSSAFTVTTSTACGILVSASLKFAAVKPIPFNSTLTAKSCHPV